MSADELTAQVGDIVLFAGTDQQRKARLADKLIMLRTHSKWVHAGIVSAPGLMTSARSDGIRTEQLPAPDGIIPTATHCRDLSAGLAALHTWNGQPYGFGDILNQLLSLLHVPFSLHFVRAWDCSHTAVEFLNEADFAWPVAARAEVGSGENVTPADLARSLGVFDVHAQRWQPPQQ